MKLNVGGSVIALDSFNDPSLPPPEKGQSLTVHFVPGSVLALGA